MFRFFRNHPSFLIQVSSSERGPEIVPPEVKSLYDLERALSPKMVKAVIASLFLILWVFKARNEAGSGLNI